MEHRSLKFLEASALAEQAADAPAFVVACSANIATLEVYVAAHGVLAGSPARMTQIPFGTLQQHLRSDCGHVPSVRLLLPWDFLPELDWRTGVSTPSSDFNVLLERVRTFEQRVARLPGTSIYLDCPIPPCLHDHRLNRSLRLELEAAGARLGEVLGADMFSLDNYCASGSIFSPRAIDAAAQAIVSARLGSEVPKKVLVTDLDNVMWRGVIGEVGDAIQCGPVGRGYPHFIYQGLLCTLKERGVILAAVSRNDPDLAAAGLNHVDMLLRREDFVAVLASYQPKSAQIQNLITRLNLGLDSVVFVDDNPVELHEVQTALPQVTTLQFPASTNALPDLADRLAALFSRRVITDEDRTRTDLYRTSLASLAPVQAKGADLSDFLRQLSMRLTIREPGLEQASRALQLIGKTNQFNLNGERLDADTLRQQLESGARLFTASLDDRFGTHGEILACLIGADGVVETLVMSCRVFQREVEFAVLDELSERLQLAELRFRFRRTPKNEPTQLFLEKFAGADGVDAVIAEGEVVIPRPVLASVCSRAHGLFEVVFP
jgi:FkbH-like protein